MFSRTLRKKFHVSTSRFYIAGRRSALTKIMHLIFPYAQRSGYRLSTSGSLVAL